VFLNQMPEVNYWRHWKPCFGVVSSSVGGLNAYDFTDTEDAMAPC